MSHQNQTRYLLALVRAAIILAWTPTLAAAAAASIDSSLSPLVIDWMLVGISGVIATLSGATALFIRVNNLLMRDKPLVRPWLFAVAHMLGSWSAGIAGFLLARTQHDDVWTTLLMVLALAFTGAKALEMLAERFLPVVRPGGEP